MTLERRISRLGHAKAKLLERLLDEEGLTPRALSRPARGRTPLSWSQESLWFVEQLNPGRALYNNPAAIRLRGPVIGHRLSRALSYLVARHESLRLRIEEDQDGPVSVFDASTEVVLPVVDLRALPARERLGEAVRLARREAALPFDLARGPLWRLILLRLEPDDHVGLLTLNHIASDAWSSAILIRELGAVYRALVSDQPVPLEPLSVQYSDYARDQRRRLSGPEGEEQRRFWSRRLNGAPTLLDLPTDRPRPAVQSVVGRMIAFDLDPELGPELESLEGRCRATRFMVMMAAFSGLVVRLSGQRDIVLGVPVANRPRKELEKVIGLFANTLPLRIRIPPRLTGLELITKVRQAILEAFVHQEVPFEQVVTELNPERSLSHSPLVQVLFGAFNAPDGSLDFGDVRCFPFETHSGTAPFDLTWTVGEAGLRNALEYNSDLFDETTVRRWIGHFEMMLRSLVADGESGFESLPLLTLGERHQIVREWQQDAVAAPASGTLHGIFESTAKRWPNSVAVVSNGASWTYETLNRRADHLATEFARRGVGPEGLVALLVEPGADFAAALLGVLKAGAAFLPLDPADPPSRIRRLLAEARPRLVVHQQDLAWQLGPQPESAMTFEVGQDGKRGSSESSPNTAQVLPQGLAYVFFTSGSTGRPKGVLVSHGAAVGFVEAASRKFGLGPADRFLQFASAAFDVVVEELFPTWASGGRVVFAPRRHLLDPASFGKLVERHSVTAVELPRVYFSELLAGGLGAPETSLRLVVVGCGAPSWEEARRLVRRGVSLIHVFGLTETAVTSTAFGLEAGRPLAPTGGRHLPIGRPLPGVRAQVVDLRLRPKPIGVPGELFVAGVGIGRCYLDRAAETASRFVPDPFSMALGGRGYRTGDLARLLSDGSLEFLGRTDRQVKVRGVRVELGEIEACLTAHPAVRSAAVVTDESADHLRLTAYYSTREALSDGELRAYAEESLPSAMIPARLVELDRMPMLTNGKIDLSSLPQQGPTRGPSRSLSHAEKILAGIWCEVLGQDQVAEGDSFFELGGDSILAIQVSSRARHLGIDVPPHRIFTHPTLEALASIAVPRQVTCSQAPAQGACALTPIQRWLFEQGLPEPSHWNQAVLLEPEAQLDRRALQRAVAALARQHDSLRLRAELEGGSWRQRYAARPDLPLLWIDLSEVRPGERRAARRWVLDRAHAAIELAQGPTALVAAMSCATEDGAERVLIVAHHSQVDEVSWRILLEDLADGYSSARAGREVTLPPRTLAYRDWAESLQRQATSAEIVAEADWWLETAEKVTGLPPADGGRLVAGSVSSRLSSKATARLLRCAAGRGPVAIEAFLITALVEALSPWVGRRSLTVDLEGHGRDEEAAGGDLSRTVGWFTCRYPVHLDLEGVDRGVEAATWTQSLLRRIPRRGLGFGVLRYLSRDPALKRRFENAPPIDVAFNYLGRLDGLRAERCFRRLAEKPGRVISPRNPASHRLDVSGGLIDGSLQMTWSYREDVARERVEEAASHFLSELDHLGQEAAWSSEREAALRDHAALRIDRPVLDRLHCEVGPIEQVLPLSPMQQGLLFQSLAAPEAGEYLDQVLFSLSGDAELDLFERAWRLLVDRTPALRSVFVWEGVDQPLQVVLAKTPRRLVKRQREPIEGSIESSISSEVSRGLALDVFPLSRLIAWHLSGCWKVLWIHHHIQLDGWSKRLLLEELSELYLALRSGRSPRLQDRPPFGEFLAALDGRQRDREETFWRDYLAGVDVPFAVDLPPPGPAPTGVVYGTADLRLGAAAVEELRGWCSRNGLTLYSVVQGLWAALLGRYAGRREVLFGGVVSGRATAPELEETIGLLINTLPVRVRLDATNDWVELLKALQADQAEARRFEHTPLVDVQRWVGLGAGVALFDSVVALETESEQVRGPWPVDDLSEQRTGYPLHLLARTGDGLLLRVTHQSAYIRSTLAHRMVRQLARSLESLPAARAPRTSDFPVMALAERHQLLTEWNDSERDHDVVTSLAEILDERADMAPDRIAAVCGDASLSYAELRRRSGALADRLAKLGSGPEQVIAVHADRGLPWLISFLGVLRTGAVYLPLDPSDPPARIRSLVARSKCHSLLVDRATLGTLARALAPLREAPPWLVIEEMTKGDRTPRPPVNLPGSALAYVLFTSGSTGQPKGAMVTRAGMLNHLWAKVEELELDETDRVGQTASQCFDVSVWQLVVSILVTGTVTIYGDEVALDPPRLLHLAESHRVTIVEVVPSALQAVLDDPPASGRGALRWMISTGEALSTELAARWLSFRPDVPLLNAYGPTECSDDVTHERVSGRIDATGRVPIGGSVDNLWLYLLDRQLEPTPLGAAGELCVGGVGVGRGYLFDPVRTAEVFIPDPFSSAPGARIYRTGDRVRVLEVGRFDFLGRFDHQIKLRGQRLELGEVEAALAALDGVRQAAAALRYDRPGDPRLVVYFVGDSGVSPQPSELRRGLADRLPASMLPTLFVPLDALPRTASGKLDRGALPSPDERALPRRATTPPISDDERQVADVWRQVLGIEAIGRHDNFFDLGGHSLLLVRVRSRLRRTDGTSPSITDLFRHPTVSSLAAFMARPEPEATSADGLTHRAARQREAVRRQAVRRQSERTRHAGS